VEQVSHVLGFRPQVAHGGRVRPLNFASIDEKGSAMIGSYLLAVALAQAPAAPQPPVPPAASPSQPAQPKYPSTVGGRTLAEWLKELNESKDGAVREFAVKALPQFGPIAREPSLKPLIKAVREDGDPGVRVNAIITLGAIGANNKDEAKQIVDALKLAINNAALGGVVRLHASRAIAGLGNYPEQANEAIATLVNIAKDPSWETRKSIAYALGQIGGPTKPKVEVKVQPGQKLPDVDPKTGPNQAALKALLGMLGDSSATVRMQVVESLTLLGPPAVNPEQYSTVVTPYMAAIAERTKSEKDKSILIWLQMLTMRLDGNQFNETTMGKIVEHAKDADLEVQIQALSALGLLGEKSMPVGLPLARDLLRSPEIPVVVAAAQYIAGLGTIAKPALSDLEQAKTAAKEEWLKKGLESAIDVLNGKKPPATPEPKK
jgi:HEAT repeat protein